MSYIDSGLYQQLGIALRNARDNANMTLADVSAKLNITLMTVQRYEKAERKINIETIRDLCSIYGVDADKLMQDAINKFHEMNAAVSYLPALSASEQTLINNYRELNEGGQEKLVDYAADLVALGRYKKRDQYESLAKNA